LLHERLACTMFTLLVSPASFASASLAPFPSLLRPAATLAAADIEGVHAPVLCLTRRPGSWRQLKAWLHRKMVPQPRECTKAVATSVSGESPQRVHTWFSGCTDKYATTVAAKVTALSPARRPPPATSEATPCPIPRLKSVRSVPPIHKHQRKLKLARMKATSGILDWHARPEDSPHRLHPSSQPSSFRGPQKPSALAVKPCLTLHPRKPKRSIRFAATSLVQEYTRWNYKGEPPVDTELVGSPYERRFKRVQFSFLKPRGLDEFERYLEPDGHNQVNFPRTRWIRDGPTGDDVDADGDVDMG